MRKAVILLITLICTSGILAQEYSNPTVEQIATCGLPVFVVTTVNEEEPACDIIYAPEGENGASITNVTKVPGHLTIIKGDSIVYDSGDYQEDVSGITFRIRGNTSAIWKKKPYKINLQKKADLLFRNDDSYKDKEWILLSNYELINPIGFKMNELMGMQWAPGFTMINLFVNGDYRGIYTLCESVKRNADARLDVDKKTGYIFECDPYWWNENVYFESDSGKTFTFKYPSDKDITDEQIDYMHTYINKVESSIAEGTYSNYIDVESFASWLLGMDILGNRDAAGANIFLTKYDNTDDTKIKMGNFWDFGAVATVDNENWSAVHNKYFYFQDLLSSPCSDFVDAYKQLWTENGASIKSKLLFFIFTYPKSDMAKGIESSVPYEMERWQYFDEETTQTQANSLYTYFINRFNWLSENIPALYSTGIKDIKPDTKENNTIYNILGQKVDVTPKKGIFIVNGKKYICR